MPEMTIQDSKERDYVRELARQVAEIAACPENRRICQRWCDVNALRKPDRPPVWCRPVGAWRELLPEDALCCADSWLRSCERNFKMILIKHDIGDDSPVDPYISVHATFDCDPPNLWGMDIRHRPPGSPGGAWAYDPPLKTEGDFDRLRIPTFHYNEARTQESLSRTHELLGDILPVKPVCGPLLGATLGTAAADLRGLTQMMVDMVDRPELMHRLMGHLRDCTLQSMCQVEETGLGSFRPWQATWTGCMCGPGLPKRRPQSMPDGLPWHPLFGASQRMDRSGG